VTTAVSLQVENVDLNDDDTMHVLGSHFSDLLWASVDGLVTATIYVDAGDVVAHTVQTSREIEARLHGAHVRRVQRDLVSQSDIASRVGVSREAVRKWTQRLGEGSFPAPFATIGGEARPSKVWLWSDIQPWLQRSYAIDMGEDLPDDETVAHIDACLAKVDTYLDREWHTATNVPTAARAVPSRRRVAHLQLVGKPMSEYAQGQKGSVREKVRA